MSIIETIHSAHTAWETARKFQAFTGWTFQAFEALFNHLDEMSDDMPEPLEFDPVAWACEFTPWESAIECCQECHTSVATDAFNDAQEWAEDDTEALADEVEDVCLSFLQENATTIDFSGGIVVQDF